MAIVYHGCMAHRTPTGPIPHGTHNGYVNYACRCEACKRAHAAYAIARYHGDHEVSKAKARAKYHARKTADPERIARMYRNNRYRTKYGIDHDEYDRLMALPCAICGGPSAVLDHHHDTGKVRDALCANCNTGLGMFAESPKRLGAAIAYIARHLGGDLNEPT